MNNIMNNKEMVEHITKNPILIYLILNVMIFIFTFSTTKFKKIWTSNIIYPISSVIFLIVVLMFLLWLFKKLTGENKNSNPPPPDLLLWILLLFVPCVMFFCIYLIIYIDLKSNDDSKGKKFLIYNSEIDAGIEYHNRMLWGTIV